MLKQNLTKTSFHETQNDRPFFSSYGNIHVCNTIFASLSFKHTHLGLPVPRIPFLRGRAQSGLPDRRGALRLFASASPYSPISAAPGQAEAEIGPTRMKPSAGRRACAATAPAATFLAADEPPPACVADEGEASGALRLVQQGDDLCEALLRDL